MRRRTRRRTRLGAGQQKVCAGKAGFDARASSRRRPRKTCTTAGRTRTVSWGRRTGRDSQVGWPKVTLSGNMFKDRGVWGNGAGGMSASGRAAGRAGSSGPGAGRHVSGEGRETHLRADGRAMACPGRTMDYGRSAGCVRVALAKRLRMSLREIEKTRKRAAADGGSRNGGGNTREEREGQSTESETESPPEQPGLSRGGWRLLEVAADRARPRVKGQKVTQSRPPPAPAPAAATHSCSPCSLFCTSSAGGGGGRAGAGQYLYAGVGRGYHAACLVSSPPLAQI